MRKENGKKTDKECYAVLKDIKHYHTYLANTKFTVVTDHKSLVG